MATFARTAALSFLDAIGTVLALKERYTFRELAEYCRSEGILRLANNDISPEVYIAIAQDISELSEGHIQVLPQATPSVTLATRTPLSFVDMGVATVTLAREAGKGKENKWKWEPCKACAGSGKLQGTCHLCKATGRRNGKECAQCEGTGQITGPCWTCGASGEVKRPKSAGLRIVPIKIDAQVKLLDGTELQVVAIHNNRYLGIDAHLRDREFTIAEVYTVANLDDQASEVEKTKCKQCGEENSPWNKDCVICETPIDFPLAAK